jgi:hypothetical protein
MGGLSSIGDEIGRGFKKIGKEWSRFTGSDLGKVVSIGLALYGAYSVWDDLTSQVTKAASKQVTDTSAGKAVDSVIQEGGQKIAEEGGKKLLEEGAKTAVSDPGLIDGAAKMFGDAPVDSIGNLASESAVSGGPPGMQFSGDVSSSTVPKGFSAHSGADLGKSLSTIPSGGGKAGGGFFSKVGEWAKENPLMAYGGMNTLVQGGASMLGDDQMDFMNKKEEMEIEREERRKRNFSGLNPNNPNKAKRAKWRYS